MDRRVEQIITGLQRLLKSVETSFIATVETDKKTTVDVKDFNGTLYPDVRKIATENAKGFVPKLPKGSFVIVSRLSGSDELCISMMSEIEGITLDVSDTIEINGGTNDGLVIVGKMVDWMQKVHGDLTTLTGLLATIPVATTPTGMVGSVTFSPSTPSPTNAMFENKKIKH
jgi:hypothetical protein